MAGSPRTQVEADLPKPGPSRSEYLSWHRYALHPVKLVEYSGLNVRKDLVLRACKLLGLSVTVQKLFISMAMIESNDLSSRDTSKNSDPMSKNYSMFNLNGYMLWKMGCIPPIRYMDGLPFTRSDIFSSFSDSHRHLTPPHARGAGFESTTKPSFLPPYFGYENKSVMVLYDVFNRDDCLIDLILYMANYLGKIGPKPFLFFVRAGGTGFEQLEQTIKYEWRIYMAGLATALDIIDDNPSILADSFRIEMPIPHITDDGKADPTAVKPIVTPI